MQNICLVAMQHGNVHFCITCVWISSLSTEDKWKPSTGEKRVAKCEFDKHMEKHAVKVVLSNRMVSHLPHEFIRTAWYFLACSGKISVEVIGCRWYCKQLCRGMEIPCQKEFNYSKKLQMVPLEATTFIKSSDQQPVSICLIFIH